MRSLELALMVSLLVVAAGLVVSITMPSGVSPDSIARMLARRLAYINGMEEVDVGVPAKVAIKYEGGYAFLIVEYAGKKAIVRLDKYLDGRRALESMDVGPRIRIYGNATHVWLGIAYHRYREAAQAEALKKFDVSSLRVSCFMERASIGWAAYNSAVGLPEDAWEYVGVAIQDGHIVLSDGARAVFKHAVQAVILAADILSFEDGVFRIDLGGARVDLGWLRTSIGDGIILLMVPVTGLGEQPAVLLPLEVKVDLRGILPPWLPLWLPEPAHELEVSLAEPESMFLEAEDGSLKLTIAFKPTVYFDSPFLKIDIREMTADVRVHGTEIDATLHAEIRIIRPGVWTYVVSLTLPLPTLVKEVEPIDVSSLALSAHDDIAVGIRYIKVFAGLSELALVRAHLSGYIWNTELKSYEVWYAIELPKRADALLIEVRPRCEFAKLVAPDGTAIDASSVVATEIEGGVLYKVSGPLPPGRYLLAILVPKR